MERYPISQKELLRYARGEATQREFSNELGVEPSSYCRYESEKLGAPVFVINACLKKLFAPKDKQNRKHHIDTALTHARKIIEQLEEIDE
ncbi:XRE family transcriptional regulator [Limnobacter sp.]|jgi:hypothetical protein|uniref:XRE family transcriptional regulator n=1 Tax=Limnobacter sp. TaxID=2003368 RepID=UPI0025C602D9|nr:XRE family transcriptional regulator [Limnobacter sp.]